MIDTNTRKIFIETLTELAEKDPTIILIVGDVGFSYIEEFGEKFPKQFVNAGVTEQSYMGIAAGLALSGWKPYVYSMIPFVTMRNYEQLRNDVCYHNANVKVIGVQGSLHYKFLGFSHNIQPENEDVKILDHLPNLQIYTPALQDVRKVMLESYESPNPAYIRL
jgi:transketolase